MGKIKQRPGFTLGAISLIGLFLVAGCANTPNYRYYRLQAEVAEQTMEPISQSVGLEPVILPAWMDSEVLAWNEGAYNIQRLEFERWGGEARTLINQTISQNLSSLTGQEEITIGPWFANNRPDLAIEVTIENLSYTNGALTLTTTWKIKDKRRKSIDVSTKYSTSTPILPTDPVTGQSLARGMSQLLADLSQAIVKQLPK